MYMRSWTKAGAWLKLECVQPGVSVFVHDLGYSLKLIQFFELFSSEFIAFEEVNLDHELLCYKQEDLENALQRAFKQQQRVNPALKVNTDIQVWFSIDYTFATFVHYLSYMLYSYQLEHYFVHL